MPDTLVYEAYADNDSSFTSGSNDINCTCVVRVPKGYTKARISYNIQSVEHIVKIINSINASSKYEGIDMSDKEYAVSENDKISGYLWAKTNESTTACVYITLFK